MLQSDAHKGLIFDSQSLAPVTYYLFNKIVEFYLTAVFLFN